MATVYNTKILCNYIFQVGVFRYQLTPEKSIEMKSFEIWRQTEMFYVNGVHCVKSGDDECLYIIYLNCVFFFTVLMCFHEKILSLLIAINVKYFPENSSLRKVHYVPFCFHFVFVKNVFRKMLQIIGIFLFRHSEAIFLFAKQLYSLMPTFIIL